jgi:DNA-binding response OmpR family regulator
MNVLTSVPRTLPLASWDQYILVLADDLGLLDSYRAALRAAGFAAVGVDDGSEALRLVETQRPSAILLDLAQTRLDCREVQRRSNRTLTHETFRSWWSSVSTVRI